MEYWDLNDVTKNEYFPIPKIDNILDALSGAKWLLILDLHSDPIPRRQREDSVLHRPEAMARHNYALWPLQRSGIF
jgi:hypothetical protein